MALLLQHPQPQQLSDAAAAEESVAAATAQLHRSVRQGDVDSVRSLLGRHPRLLYAHDTHGKTPLMLAAYKGHESLVKALLKGHEPRRRERGSGPSREVCPQCTATLQQAGGCCCLLRKSEALVLAAWFGHPQVCATLLAFGADPNIRNSWGT